MAAGGEKGSQKEGKNRPPEKKKNASAIDRGRRSSARGDAQLGKEGFRDKKGRPGEGKKKKKKATVPRKKKKTDQ